MSIQDIRPRWFNVVRSLQKAACKNNGIAVVSSRIVVNESGDPVTWTEPDVTKLGPLSSQDELIRLLGSLPSGASRENFLMAQALEDERIVINKGGDAGVLQNDLFVYIDIEQPYAILCVDELRQRITILKAIWVRSNAKASLKIGDPLHRIYW